MPPTSRIPIIIEEMVTDIDLYYPMSPPISYTIRPGDVLAQSSSTIEIQLLPTADGTVEHCTFNKSSLCWHSLRTRIDCHEEHEEDIRRRTVILEMQQAAQDAREAAERAVFEAQSTLTPASPTLTPGQEAEAQPRPPTSKVLTFRSKSKKKIMLKPGLPNT